MPSNVEIIVLAAGKGVRMNSELPKVLHSVCGFSVLWRVLESVAGLQPSRIVVVVGHGSELVESEIARFQEVHSSLDVQTVLQKEQRGTGHAAQLALGSLSKEAEAVLILPGDIPLVQTETLKPAVSDLENGDLVVVTGVPEDPSGYGRVIRNDSGEVQAIVEQKDCSESEASVSEINSSIYAAKKSFLEDALKTLSPLNAQGELYLTDIVAYGVKNQNRVRAIQVERFSDIAGSNNRTELSQLESLRRAEIVNSHMLSGVGFALPESVLIDEGVSIGKDSWIGPGVQLTGATSVAENVTLEGYSFVRNSQIGSGSCIRWNCYLDSVSIAETVCVGPFAHLRPGAVLDKEVRVGNFVEVKKTHLMPGAKANHLTYLGDAKIGPGVNVGAGTITCNYDGKSKHQTVIEEGAFIGSNTALVAPVKVGANSVIGAGSVITKNVPKDSLGLGRARQKVVEGWVKQHRS